MCEQLHVIDGCEAYTSFAFTCVYAIHLLPAPRRIRRKDHGAQARVGLRKTHVRSTHGVFLARLCVRCKPQWAVVAKTCARCVEVREECRGLR